MKQYLNILSDVLENGEYKNDRTGVGTYSVFGRSIKIDVSSKFPLLTTKKLHWKSIIYELLWFLRGDTNIEWLNEHGVTIWDEWATESGQLGPIYGKQWRDWEYMYVSNQSVYSHVYTGHIDQISKLIEGIKERPDSRRHIVSAWNVADLPDEMYSPQENVQMGRMALAPCHLLFQCYIRGCEYLDIQVYQRSADVFLGLPYNIASYSALLYLLAHLTGYKPGELHWIGGDVHLYSNHIEQAKEQLSREPLELPTLKINKELSSINVVEFKDFILEGYNAHPHIKAEIAV